jgi:hypothetical protein
MIMFRELNAEELQEFKQWARDNYTPGSDISSLWHPVIQEECHTINAEVAVDMEMLSRQEFEAFMQSKEF